jgi:threonine dehydratase
MLMIQQSVTTSMATLTTARTGIMPHLHRTPLWRSEMLSALAGCEVWLKAELFQKTGSYKPRGMLWALMNLEPEVAARGAITFSAGNAAQGLAFAGRILGIDTKVVMPATASPAKAAATRGYGAEVVLFGTPQECLAHCLETAEREGRRFISSYDDEALMTGHASLGLEVLEDCPDAAAIFVGIGGGGMAGGLAMAAEAAGHHVELIGVEPAGAPAMHRSLEAGQAVHLDKVSTIADGLAAPTAGERCLAWVQKRFSSVEIVEDDGIAAAMRLLMTRAKLFAEPAGSAALAGLLGSGRRFRPTDKVVCIVSGGNIDTERLATLL